MIAAVVLDVEGTTSSAAHVRERLFPYARERLAEWVTAHRGDPSVRAALGEVRRTLARGAGGADADDAAVIRALEQWSDEDRKITPLKTLQGMIWAEGYAGGELHGHVYPDTVEALRTWRDRGACVYVYSSGSVLAQQNWFAHTAFGDLRSRLDGYFDTRTAGPKRSASSYESIARSITVPPERILFASDTEEELDAAGEARWRTALVDRPEERPPGAAGHAGRSGAGARHRTHPDLISVARREDR